MTLRREVEARGAFSLEDALRTQRIARLERTVAQGWRLIDAHRKRIDRLLGSHDLRRSGEAIESQKRRIAQQQASLRELNQLRGIA